jgi:hypothetical protein
MKEVQPESRSMILRATHILVVRIDAADDPPWTPRPAGSVGEERMIHLRLAIEEIVKGVVKEKPGDVVDVAAKQARVEFGWGPMPGIWSNSLVDPGTRVVAFSSTTSEDAAVVLDDPAGIRLLPPPFALLDVHVAAQIEQTNADLAGAAAILKKDGEGLADLAVEYLWERYGIAALADVSKFETVAALLEEPKLSGTARNTLLMTVSSAVRGHEPPKTKHVSRLAVAMFHLLAMPEAKDLHDNLVGTHIPNLLGLQHGGDRTADQVFEDHPAEKARALQAVQSYKGAQPTAPLLDWLTR